MKGKIECKQLWQYTINQLKAAHGFGDVVDDSIGIEDTSDEELPLSIQLQFSFYSLITIIKAKLEGYEIIDSLDGYGRPKVADALIAKMELEGDRPFGVLLKEVESYIVANFATLKSTVICRMPDVLFLPLPKSDREYYDNFKVNSEAYDNNTPFLLLNDLPSCFSYLFAHLIVYEPSNEKMNREYMRADNKFTHRVRTEVLNILNERLEKDFATEESGRLLLQRVGDFLAGIINFDLIPGIRENRLTKLFENCDKVGLLDGLFDKVINEFSEIVTNKPLYEYQVAGLKRISRCLNEHGKRPNLLAFLGNKPNGIEKILELIRLEIIPAYQLSSLELCPIAAKLDELALRDDFKTKYYDANPKFFVACIKHFAKCVESNACNNLVKFMLELQPQLREKAALVQHISQSHSSNTQLSTTTLTLGSGSKHQVKISLPNVTKKYSEELESSQPLMYTGM